MAKKQPIKLENTSAFPTAGMVDKDGKILFGFQQGMSLVQMMHEKWLAAKGDRFQ